MYKDFDKMLTYKIDDRIRKEATDYILRVTQEERLEGMSTRKLKILDTLDMCIDKEISDLGKNLWSLFNGVTRYTTHELNSRSCEVAFGNMFGHANELNGRAYQFAKELIK
jgi:hypothetical protein